MFPILPAGSPEMTDTRLRGSTTCRPRAGSATPTAVTLERNR